jgi:hypothetical protein
MYSHVVILWPNEFEKTIALLSDLLIITLQESPEIMVTLMQFPPLDYFCCLVIVVIIFETQTILCMGGSFLIITSNSLSSFHTPPIQ